MDEPHLEDHELKEIQEKFRKEYTGRKYKVPMYSDPPDDAEKQRIMAEAVKKKMMEDPQYRRSQELTDKMRKAEVIRHTDLETPDNGAQPHITPKVANVPTAIFGQEEQRLVTLINDLIGASKKANHNDPALVKEISCAIMQSQDAEKKLGSLHRQALEQIEERFHNRILPLSNELRRLNELPRLD